MRIVVVGAGAIGSRTVKLVEQLGEVFLLDRDIVMTENLQNQLYDPELLEIPKAYALQKEFPHIRALAVELNENNAELLQSDIVLDCVDNLATRKIINKYCVEHGIPWIHSAAIGNKAQVMAVLPEYPCFESVFGGKSDGLKCEADSINPDAANLAAKLQVGLMKKVLNDEVINPVLIQKTTDGKRNEYAITKDKNLSKEKIKLQKMCGSDMYQFYTDKKINEPYIKKENAWIFSDGRVLIKAKSEEEAKKSLKLII